MNTNTEKIITAHGILQILMSTDIKIPAFSTNYPSKPNPKDPEFHLIHNGFGFIQVVDRFNIMPFRRETQTQWLNRMEGENNSFAELYLETAFKGLIPTDENGCYTLPNGECVGERGCPHDVHSQYKALPVIMQYQEGAITLRELTNYLCVLIYPELYDQDLLKSKEIQDFNAFWAEKELPQLCYNWVKKHERITES